MAQPLHKNNLNFFVIWNVGQGQWATFVHPNYCHHFDMGGEKNPIKRVLKWCEHKTNTLFISHTDKDHINFVKFYTLKTNTCLNTMPYIRKRQTQINLQNLKVCSQKILPFFSPIKQKINTHHKTSINDLSDIYIFQKKILIPGDSTKKMEKIWAGKIPKDNKIKYLLLGHHGSKYSNSPKLLNKLKKIKLTIASARKSKYGHPHSAVKVRLTQKGVPLLSTEQWGDIYIYDF